MPLHKYHRIKNPPPPKLLISVLKVQDLSLGKYSVRVYKYVQTYDSDNRKH